jgi:hypothetical protein
MAVKVLVLASAEFTLPLGNHPSGCYCHLPEVGLEELGSVLLLRWCHKGGWLTQKEKERRNRAKKKSPEQQMEAAATAREGRKEK